MDKKTVDLGTQDPELKNSPIVWESDEEPQGLRESIPGEPVCFFNDEAYAHNTVIKSGTVLLRCDYGLWVPAGPSDTENP